MEYKETTQISTANGILMHNSTDNTVLINKLEEVTEDVLGETQIIRDILNTIKEVLPKNENYELKQELISKESWCVILKFVFVDSFFATDVLNILNSLIIHSKEDLNNISSCNFIEWCIVVLETQEIFPLYEKLLDVMLTYFKRAFHNINDFYDHPKAEELVKKIIDDALFPDRIETNVIIMSEQLDFDIRQGIRISSMFLLAELFSGTHEIDCDINALSNLCSTVIIDQKEYGSPIFKASLKLLKKIIQILPLPNENAVNDNLIISVVAHVNKYFNENDSDKEIIKLLVKLIHSMITNDEEERKKMIDFGLINTLLTLYFKKYNVLSDISLLLSSGMEDYMIDMLSFTLKSIVDSKSPSFIFPLVGVFLQQIPQDKMNSFFNDDFSMLDMMCDCLESTITPWEIEQIVRGIEAVLHFATVNGLMEKVGETASIEQINQVLEDFNE